MSVVAEPVGNLASLVNGRAIDRSAIPELDIIAFQQAIVSAVEHNQRVIALFGSAKPEDAEVQVYVVLADDEQARLRLAQTRIKDNRFDSLTPRCPQGHLFEREMCEQFGLRAVGHPWFKP